MLSWFDAILQGVLLGGLYALFAAGLSLMFGIMRLVNLAHGDLIVLAAFVILVIAETLGANIFIAALIALPVMFIVGFAMQQYLLNYTLGKDILPPLLVTFGISIVIQNGLLESFSADSRRLQVFGLETESWSLGGGIAVGVMPVMTFATAVLAILAVNWVMSRTELGRAFRATSDDPRTAQLMGIDNSRVFAIATGIAFVLITLSALYFGNRAQFDPTIGSFRLLYAFEAVIIGGLGSLWGTLAGGIILGVAQTIGAKIDPEWQLLAGHVVFLLVLVVRPRGLFPRSVD